MESDKLTRRLTKWVLLLQEYDFKVHGARITNLDANGLSCKPSPLDEDLIEDEWHGDCDQDAVPRWHAVAYLVVEIPI